MAIAQNAGIPVADKNTGDVDVVVEDGYSGEIPDGAIKTTWLDDCLEANDRLGVGSQYYFHEAEAETEDDNASATADLPTKKTTAKAATATKAKKSAREASKEKEEEEDKSADEDVADDDSETPAVPTAAQVSSDKARGAKSAGKPSKSASSKKKGEKEAESEDDAPGDDDDKAAEVSGTKVAKDASSATVHAAAEDSADEDAGEDDGEAERVQSLEAEQAEGDVDGEVEEEAETEFREPSDDEGPESMPSPNKRRGQLQRRRAQLPRAPVVEPVQDDNACPRGPPRVFPGPPPRQLTHELFLRYGSKMPRWPEDRLTNGSTIRPTPRPPRPASAPSTANDNDENASPSAPASQASTTAPSTPNSRRGPERLPFPPELLNVPRCNVGGNGPNSRFRPEEDAALLIWMIRIFPLFHRLGLATFQSPCIWHWAQQAHITSRSWESMKSRARQVLQLQITGSRPLDEDVYQQLKDNGYFVFSGHKLVHYNRAAVERDNDRSKANPTNPDLIQELGELPDAVPTRKGKRPGSTMVEPTEAEGTMDVVEEPEIATMDPPEDQAAQVEVLAPEEEAEDDVLAPVGTADVERSASNRNKRSKTVETE